MGILRDFERRLEGAVEGFFARAFRSGLQPVELAKAVQRYAADYQQVGLNGVSVPNVYRFSLSPDDHARFSEFDTSLQRELADVVRRTVDERGWQLRGPVRIELEKSDAVRVGTYELRGKTEEGPVEAPRRATSGVRGGRGPDLDDRGGGATSVLPARGAGASLRVLAGPRPGASYPLKGTAVIGRLGDCDVRLDDPSVSRRHARVSHSGGSWAVEDLGSTNGVRVNGETVGRADLQDGDRLELGSVHLAFSSEG